MYFISERLVGLNMNLKLEIGSNLQTKKREKNPKEKDYCRINELFLNSSRSNDISITITEESAETKNPREQFKMKTGECSPSFIWCVGRKWHSNSKKKLWKITKSLAWGEEEEIETFFQFSFTSILLDNIERVQPTTNTNSI